ncbi:MAG: CapA family protein [Actinomycetota bacterium]|nr:CapA family protein [Actinomycetota bacterium]
MSSVVRVRRATSRIRLAATCLLVTLSAACVGATGVSRVEDGGPVLASSTTATTAPSATTASTPATTSTTTPAPTTTTTQPRGPLVIHAAGDLNIDPGYIPALVANGYDHALAGLDGLFTTDDLTLVNLECTPSDVGVRQDRPFNFRCGTDGLGALTDGGVEVVSLANNHAMDYGPDALVDGLGQVRAAGLVPVGAGADRTSAFAPAFVERNGWRIAVVGFGGVYLATNWLATDAADGLAAQPGISDGLDLDATTAAVTAAAADADLVIVTVHWCCELETTPNARNRAHTEAWLAAGADIVIGHHQHRLQPLELVDGHPVAWGLGNFVWPRFSAAGSDTAVARIEVAPDGAVTACLLDATIVSHGHPTLDDPTRRTCAPAG